ncbi:MAG: thermonuclease family protein [Ignavibacteria bacterium]|nr:thermonuclease family protein [Ignavibacteria bacterium]
MLIKRSEKSYSAFIISFLIFTVFFSCNLKTSEDSVAGKNDKFKKPPSAETDHNSGNEYLIVLRVIDGDTFKMSDGEKVRLIGIDTPEKYESSKLDRESERTGRDKSVIKKLGEEATEYVRNLAEGKKVRLVREKSGYDKDKYGRLLRYVYLEDGTFLNAKIIEDGYANVYNSPEVSKLNEFRELERSARENKRGLWGETEGLK